AASFAVGSPALFHFTQLFPWRRPWIRAHGRWLMAGYVLLPIPTAFVAWVVGALLGAMQSDAGAGGLGAVSAGLAETFVLLCAIPVIFVVGVVLPFAGVMSLVKSWREAKEAANEPARETMFWML